MTPGDIILVRFPFANLEQSKKRPALLMTRVPVNRSSSLLTIAMITSQIEGLELDGDVLIREWEKAKLLHPSLIRLSKLATVDSELLERRLGTLDEADLREVKRVFKRLYARWM